MVVSADSDPSRRKRHSHGCVIESRAVPTSYIEGVMRDQLDPVHRQQDSPAPRRPAGPSPGGADDAGVSIMCPLDGFPYLGIVGLDDKWNVVSRPEEVVPTIGVLLLASAQ